SPYLPYACQQVEMYECMSRAYFVGRKLVWNDGGACELICNQAVRVGVASTSSNPSLLLLKRGIALLRIPLRLDTSFVSSCVPCRLAELPISLALCGGRGQLPAHSPSLICPAWASFVQPPSARQRKKAPNVRCGWLRVKISGTYPT
ncbi:unnamed protein product, partial [Ectocarpus sp. 13 AM-2016]